MNFIIGYKEDKGKGFYNYLRGKEGFPQMQLIKRSHEFGG
jgi:hypothetical protein